MPPNVGLFAVPSLPGALPSGTAAPAAAPGVGGGSAELVAQLLSQLQQPLPQQPKVGLGRGITGSIGDALTAAAAVRAGGSPPQIGSFQQGVQTQQQEFQERLRAAEQTNQQTERLIRIGNFQEDKRFIREVTLATVRERAKLEFEKEKGAREAKINTREFVERLAKENPEAGIDLDDSREAALRKANPFIEARNRAAIANAGALLKSREQLQGERDSKVRAIGTSAVLASGVTDEARGQMNRLSELGLKAEADALVRQVTTLADTVVFAEEDPSAANVAIIRSEIRDMRTALRDSRRRTDKAGKFLTPDAVDDIGKLFELLDNLDEMTQLFEASGPIESGGPVAGIPIVAAVFGGDTFDRMRVLTSKIARFGAFTDGGKNLTGTEVEIVEPSAIPRMTDRTRTMRNKLLGITETAQRALNRAIVNTGLTREELERLGGKPEEDPDLPIETPDGDFVLGRIP